MTGKIGRLDEWKLNGGLRDDRDVPNNNSKLLLLFIFYIKPKIEDVYLVLKNYIPK